jgi:type IX secretion system PorP/SprF family membrane protein
MIRMKNRYLFYALVVLSLSAVLPDAYGQDMNYTQYFSTPIYYNPAFTGINTGIRARFSYRNQWPSLPVSFKSYCFSVDLGDRNLPGSGGLGLEVHQDSPGIGLIHNLGAALTIGVRVPITRLVISQLGVKAGIIQRRIDWDDLIFTGQLDYRYGNINPPPNISAIESPKRVVPDFGAGGVLQFINQDRKLSGNIGFSVDHLFRPDVSFLSAGSAPYPRKFVGQIDVLFITGPTISSMASGNQDDRLKINFGGMYQHQDTLLSSLQIGLNLLKYNIFVGAWFKSSLQNSISNSCLALVAGYQYTFYEDMTVKFMYSYDLQISRSLQGTGGAHEISMILEFDKISFFGGGGGRIARGRIGKEPMESPSFY